MPLNRKQSAKTPAAAPKKATKFRRNVASHIRNTSPDKQGNKKCNRLMGRQAKQGINLINVLKPKKQEEAFIWPAKKNLLDDPDLRVDLQLKDMLPRRDPSRPQENVALPSAPDSDFPSTYFVFIADEVDPDNEHNPEQLRQDGDRLATYLNRVGHSSAYTFPASFKYTADVTPTGDLQPLNAYLLDDDVAATMLSIYSTIPKDELVRDDDLIADFFGTDNIEHGRNVILRYGDDEDTNSADSNE